jgi:hypothetical protein
MKAQFLVFLFSALIAISCDGDDDDAVINPDHQSEVPGEFRGQWLRGNFSMTQFWSHSGQYLGNAYESSIAFDFKSDGHYEQFLIFQNQNYGCVVQALSYFKGTVKFDEANNKFTVHPTEGKFRGFDNCSNSNNFSRDANEDELKVQTFYYSWSESGGTKYMEIRFNPTDEYPSYFRQVNW